MEYRRRGLVCLFLLPAAAAFTGSGTLRSTPIPRFFVGNQGQFSPGVRYSLEGAGWRADFLNRGIGWVSRGSRLNVELQGTASDLSWEGGARLAGVANFYNGSDARQWQHNVATWSSVVARDAYPGIDLTYSIQEDRLKSEFLVRAGADPSKIRLRCRGAQRVSLGSGGDLLLEAGRAQLREQRPVAWQVVGGKKIAVPAEFVLHGKTVSFRVGNYDPAADLLIDPVLSYSTYLGGSGFTAAGGVAVDGSGNAYVAGWTETRDIPASSAASLPNTGSVDVFVAKLSPGGNSLAYVTYLGGSVEDRALGVAADSSGNVVITGETQSNDWPVLGALQSQLRGHQNAFAARLNPSGTLVFSTYLGGSAIDAGNAVALDAFGSAYVAGSTTSTDFPVLSAYLATNRGAQDAFVAKISSGGSLLYSTYLGGSGNDLANGIAVGSDGQAVVTGGTFSTNFPVSAGTLQSSNRGGEDAFVARLYSAGNGISFSTYLGGTDGTPTDQEQGTAVALDASGNIYVAGVTSSADFPLAAAVQSFGGGGSDAFAAKITSAGALVYSTYLGGSNLDWATGIAVDSANSVWVGGYSSSSDFPLVLPVQQQLKGDYDGFVVHLDAGGQLQFSSYFGGSKSDSVAAVAVDSAAAVYIAGLTQSSDFPVLNPVQLQNYSGYSALVAKFSPCTYSLSQTGITISAGSASGAITVTAGSSCQFAAASNVGWLTLSVSGSSVTWNAAANTGSERVGTLTIAGQSVSVTQAAPPPVQCTYSLSQTAISIDYGAAAGTITVSTNAGCTFAAASNAGWLTVSVAGNSVSWAAAANTGAQRVGGLTIAGQSATVTQAAQPVLVKPTVAVNLTILNFGTNSQLITSPQQVSVNFSGPGDTSWTVSSNRANITVSPTSSSGNRFFYVTAASGASGVVTLTAPGSVNVSLQITVNIATVVPTIPFGSFDTPVNNSTGLSGNVPVTGWALDSIEVMKVDIWREPIGAEPKGALVYIGDAVFIPGARPDVQGAYPKAPLNYRAGWGYMMLTNFLPNSNGTSGTGNGTYKLHAIAHNASGASIDLGTRTIVCDNAHATTPFGTIDTPAQGQSVAGTVVNYGWALTQTPKTIPTDGSTILVVVDGQVIGHPVYNLYRSDIATLFPGYTNSVGGVGYFSIDTTKLANGIHSIAWAVTDNQGNGAGLGSRYFFVNNP